MINVSFNIDDELKRELDAFCEKIGMDITNVFTIYAKRIVAEQRIPFDIFATVNSAKSVYPVERNVVSMRNKKVYSSTDIDGAMTGFVNYVLDNLGADYIATTAEIKEWCEQNCDTNPASIIPSDYCYNRTNNGLNKEGRVYRPQLLEFVGRGRFRVLGKNYPYTGDMYARPRGYDEDIVVGHWENGKFFEAQ